MATISGNDGSVAIGATGVGKVTQFTIEETTAQERDDAMGDAWTSQKGGKKSWNGQITVRYNKADSGQQLLLNGATGTGNFYPEGNSSGNTYFTGSFLVTAVSHTQDQDDRVMKTISVVGDGALTETTVS